MLGSALVSSALHWKESLCKPLVWPMGRCCPLWAADPRASVGASWCLEAASHSLPLPLLGLSTVGFLSWQGPSHSKQAAEMERMYKQETGLLQPNLG